MKLKWLENLGHPQKNESNCPPTCPGAAHDDAGAAAAPTPPRRSLLAPAAD